MPSLNETPRAQHSRVFSTHGDQCSFELLDVNALQDPCSGTIVHLYALVLRCHACETVFRATEGSGFASMSGARVLRCPTGCGQQLLKAPTLRRWRPQAAAVPAVDAA